ncbi:protein piccolo-like [Paralichthys olivaceus]|uniref:protein piccolo-like n=1 Tax=Paralichthys olivaceus TaxID=8255 RepID=UPI0037514C17
MAWSRGSKILFCLGLFVVASSFCSCSPLTRLKALDKLKENSMISQGSGLHHGRLLIGQNSLEGAKVSGIWTSKDLLDLNADYQDDIGWAEPKRAKGQGDDSSRPKPADAAVEQLLKLEPKVECTGDSMKLQIQDAASTPGSLFFVDRGSNQSPLPLSKLPQSCGYTIRSTRRDFVLVAPYDGCFVAHEEDSYVLPLRWWGLPVRMSCPLMRPSAPNPPMVTCHTEGMVVKTEWMISVAKIKVNLNDVWEPLMRASAKCGFSVVVHPDGVVISVRYSPCLKEKDGLYTLELAGDGETKISCPSLSEAEPTKSPPNDPEPQTEMPSKGVHHFTPSHNSGSPLDQTFPQKPEVPAKKPNERPKVIAPPQMPYYPSYPNFFYPYPDIKPVTTAQPPSSPLTKTTEVQSTQTVLPSKLPMAPEGQMPQQFHPFYVWPSQPEQVPVEKETQVDSPATQPPNGKVEDLFYPYYFKPPNAIPVPTPEPYITTSPPAIQSTKGHRQPIYYPFPYKPKPPMQSPVTKPAADKLPEYLLPNNHPSGPPQKPQEPPSSKPENQEYNPQPVPPVSQEPHGQMYQPFYQYPFYPPLWSQGPYQPPMPPTKQTPTLAPNGQVKPLSPLNPETSKPQIPGNVSPSKLPSAPQSKAPSQPKAPAGKVQQYLYPYFYQPKPEKQPDEKPQPSEEPGAEKPAPIEPPPAVSPSEGRVYYPFNLYYPQQPQPITLPPVTFTQTPPPNNEPSNGGKVPQGPQPGSPYMPPFYCPQFCPSGISNCCPQIAFHQHLHHFVPAGPGSENVPPVYPAQQFLSSLGYSGLGNGLADPSPEETMATTTTPAVTTESSTPENEQLPYLLPPDGNNAAPVLSIPENQIPTYPYFVPNLYLPQSQSAVNYNAPGNGHAIPYYLQPPESQMSQILPGDMKNLSWPDFMSFVAQYQQGLLANQQNEPRASELQPSNVEPSDSEEPMQAKFKSVADRFLVRHPMLQDAEAPINSSQQFVSAFKKSTNSDQIIQPNSQSKSYVLLQQGPPGREPTSYSEELLADATVQSQNLKPHQNLNPLQDNPHNHPFVSAKDGSHFAPLPKNSFNTAQINPELLEKMWKLSRPLGYDEGIPANVPGEEFQRWRSAADQRD